MTTTIDAPGLAKVSSGDLIRELTNERARVKRRRENARAKFAVFKALRDDLRPYLQPEDYEHIRGRLKREFERWDQRAKDLETSISNERDRRTIEFLRSRGLHRWRETRAS
jgi:hypothetical protein